MKEKRHEKREASGGVPGLQESGAARAGGEGHLGEKHLDKGFRGCSSGNRYPTLHVDIHPQRATSRK